MGSGSGKVEVIWSSSGKEGIVPSFLSYLSFARFGLSPFRMSSVLCLVISKLTLIMIVP